MYKCLFFIASYTLLFNLLSQYLNLFLIEWIIYPHLFFLFFFWPYFNLELRCFVKQQLHSLSFQVHQYVLDVFNVQHSHADTHLYFIWYQVVEWLLEIRYSFVESFEGFLLSAVTIVFMLQNRLQSVLLYVRKQVDTVE